MPRVVLPRTETAGTCEAGRFQFRVKDLKVHSFPFRGRVIILVGNLENTFSLLSGQRSQSPQLLPQNCQLVAELLHKEHFPDVLFGETMMQHRETEYVVKCASNPEVRKHTHSVADVQA